VSSEDAGPSGSRRLLVVAIASLAGFLGLAGVAATKHPSDLDLLARTLVHLARNPLLDPAMNAISGLGENYGLVPLIALGVAVLWHRSRRWALALPLLMAGTGVLQLGAKWAVDRPRPNLAALGFPSGHVLSLVVFFGLAIYLLHGSTRPTTPTLARKRGRGGDRARRRLQPALSRGALAVGRGRGICAGHRYLLPAICLVEWVAGHADGAREASAQNLTLTLPTTNGPEPTLIRLASRSE